MFEQLLRWIYVDEIDDGAVEAFGEQILMGANRFQLQGLELLVETKLCEGLSTENVATRLVLGEQAEADQLKECCLELIKPNAAAVMQVGAGVDTCTGNPTPLPSPTIRPRNITTLSFFADRWLVTCDRRWSRAHE